MQDDIERFGALDENMESLLSHEGVDGRDNYGNLKQATIERQKESSKGISSFN